MIFDSSSFRHRLQIVPAFPSFPSSHYPLGMDYTLSHRHPVPRFSLHCYASSSQRRSLFLLSSAAAAFLVTAALACRLSLFRVLLLPFHRLPSSTPPLSLRPSEVPHYHTHSLLQQQLVLALVVVQRLSHRKNNPLHIFVKEKEEEGRKRRESDEGAIAEGRDAA